MYESLITGGTVRKLWNRRSRFTANICCGSMPSDGDARRPVAALETVAWIYQRPAGRSTAG